MDKAEFIEKLKSSPVLGAGIPGWRVRYMDVAVCAAFGMKEAFFIQQLHFYLGNEQWEHDGRYWVHMTVEGWKNEFGGLWSRATVERVLARLRKLGIFIVRKDLNNAGLDRRSWYTIDYQVLENLGFGVYDKPRRGIGRIVKYLADDASEHLKSDPGSPQA